MNTMNKDTVYKIKLKDFLKLVDFKMTYLFINVVAEDHYTVDTYKLIKIGRESDIPFEWLNYEVCRIFGSSLLKWAVCIDIAP